MCSSDLKLVIAKLRRMIFGTKSEKVTREIQQLELKLEELVSGQNDIRTETDPVHGFVCRFTTDSRVGGPDR